MLSKIKNWFKKLFTVDEPGSRTINSWTKPEITVNPDPKPENLSNIPVSKKPTVRTRKPRNPKTNSEGK